MSLGAILAGGHARRLGGRPKGLIEMGGRPLVDRLADLLRALDLTPVLIGQGPHTAAYAARGLPHHPDLLPDRGPPGGVHTALALAPPGWIAVVSIDLPALDLATLTTLAAHRDHQHVVLARADGHRQPLAAWWHTRAFPLLDQHLRLQATGFGPLLAHLDVTEIALPGAAFRDLDTEAEVEAASGRWPTATRG